MRTTTWIATFLMVIGAINWGLVGLFNFNLVAALFGGFPTIETVVYILVGLAGLLGIRLLVNLPAERRETARERRHVHV
jgi:uncharacterized protein